MLNLSIETSMFLGLGLNHAYDISALDFHAMNSRFVCDPLSMAIIETCV